MIKTFWTLLRGTVYAAEQEAVDRSALLVLDQHIRDAAADIERAKRALALAIAQDEAEGKRLDSTLSRIADLEDRAAAALAAGREELATAAEAIAMMEADRDAMREARAVFAKEISWRDGSRRSRGHIAAVARTARRRCCGRCRHGNFGRRHRWNFDRRPVGSPRLRPSDQADRRVGAGASAPAQTRCGARQVQPHPLKPR